MTPCDLCVGLLLHLPWIMKRIFGFPVFTHFRVSTLTKFFPVFGFDLLQPLPAPASCHWLLHPYTFHTPVLTPLPALVICVLTSPASILFHPWIVAGYTLSLGLHGLRLFDLLHSVAYHIPLFGASYSSEFFPTTAPEPYRS